jgi:hypothetical protein
VPTILREARRLPEGVPVYVGSYGPNPDVAAQVAALPNGRYAPMFALEEPYYREQRRVPDEPAVNLDPRYAGPVPPLSRLGTTGSRVSWGVELGARYRDQIRQAAGAGAQIASWQLDEIGPTAARAGSGPLREFLRGVLRGLVFGRPQLQDASVQGLVWVAHSALALARLPITPELGMFWNMLNRAALGYVGEEYPRFDGKPVTSARSQASGQRALASGGPVREALARKYVAGMTPGYHLAAGLGGNVHDWTRPQVNSWRAQYVLQRARDGVAGLGEFDFRFGNSAQTVVHDTLSAIVEVF